MGETNFFAEFSLAIIFIYRIFRCQDHSIQSLRVSSPKFIFIYFLDTCFLRLGTLSNEEREKKKEKKRGGGLRGRKGGRERREERGGGKERDGRGWGEEGVRGEEEEGEGEKRIGARDSTADKACSAHS